MNAFEEWRDAPSTEGRYEVSSLGRARRASTGRVLACPTTVQAYGYTYRAFTDFVRIGRQFQTRVHRQVCEAFNGPPPFEGAVVRHLDGDSLNNCADNLAWGTPKENSEDAIRHGVRPRGERVNTSKLKAGEVVEMRRLADEGETPRALGERYGIATTGVYLILKRRRWTHVA